MPWEAWVTLAVVVLLLLTLARNLFPPDVTLLGALIVLLTLSLFSDKFPDARAVVVNLQADGGGLRVVQHDLCPGGLGVFADVGQALLGCPEQRLLRLRRQRPCRPGHPQLGGYAGG